LSVKINYKECEGYSNSNDRKSNYNKVKKLKKSREKLNRFLVFPEISIHIIFILALLSSIYALAGVWMVGIKNVLLEISTFLNIDGLKLIYSSEMEKWWSSYNKENSPVVFLGDFNMSFEKPKKYIFKIFPDWTVANLT